MNILLIDSDKQLGAIYSQALEIAGHTVRLATGAQMAISLADQQKPDLIILEINLPRHNGLEFLYELRSYPEWQGIPVVINSAQPSTHSAATWQKLGVISYRYKLRTSLKQLQNTVEAARDPGALARLSGYTV